MWGIGLTLADNSRLNPRFWKGGNLHGKTLMDVPRSREPPSTGRTADGAGNQRSSTPVEHDHPTSSTSAKATPMANSKAKSSANSKVTPSSQPSLDNHNEHSQSQDPIYQPETKPQSPKTHSKGSGRTQSNAGSTKLVKCRISQTFWSTSPPKPFIISWGVTPHIQLNWMV